MRTDAVDEVEVTVERKPKVAAKKNTKIGRPKVAAKKKQIPGGFTQDEVARIMGVLDANNFASISHFMRAAGLKLLEELENQ